MVKDPGNDSMWTGPRQRPLVYYTHRPPEAGPAMLGDCEVRIFAGPGAPSPETIARQAVEATALCFFVPDVIDAALMDQLPALRLLAGFGKGYDNVDVAAATARGLWVTNVPEALTDGTADLAWALILSLTRGVLGGDRFVRSGSFTGWSTSVRLGMALTGKTLGIVGYGHVGRAIGRRADGFGMRVVHCDFGSGLKLDDLLGVADVVVLAVPLTDATRHLIGAREIERMRRTAFLVNVARGSIVDEAAVADALERGAIAGYAADVFECEDQQYADRPAAIDGRLLRSERTLLTPHIGTATLEDRTQLAIVQAQSVLDVIAGRRPASAVNNPA